MRYHLLMEEAKKLNLKQLNFCNQYLKDFNATQAAIRAGYSPKSAYSQAHELLKKPEILQQIEAASQTTFKSIGLSAQRILAEFASIAFSENSSDKDKLKALEFLLKYEQINVDKTTHNIPIEFVDSGP